MNRRQSRRLAHDASWAMELAELKLKGQPSLVALGRLEREAAKASRVLDGATDLHPRDRQRVVRAHEQALDCIQESHKAANLDLTALELGLLRALDRRVYEAHTLRDIAASLHADGITGYTLDDLYAAHQYLARLRLVITYSPPPTFGVIEVAGRICAALNSSEKGQL